MTDGMDNLLGYFLAEPLCPDGLSYSNGYQAARDGHSLALKQHAMKALAYWGRGRGYPHIQDLSTRWRWVAALPPGKEPR
jgi:hypothetical protein